MSRLIVNYSSLAAIGASAGKMCRQISLRNWITSSGGNSGLGRSSSGGSFRPILLASSIRPGPMRRVNRPINPTSLPCRTHGPELLSR